MQLRKIKVYGALRKFLGKSYFEAAVDSPKDAIKFLVCNFPKVEKHLNEQIYKIKMNGVQVWQDHLALKGEGDIQIIPVAIGSAFVIPFVAGAVATAATVATTVATAVATTAVAATSAVVSAVASGAGAIYAAGQSLAASGFIGNIATTLLVNTAIGGVASLLTPTPSVENQSIDSANPEDASAFQSFGFNQIANTSISGGAVPIIYGEVFTGSIVISASTDTQQVQSS
jgi:predicted phage tail protein